MGIPTYTTTVSAEIRRDVLESLVDASEADAGFWYTVSTTRHLERVLVHGSSQIEACLASLSGRRVPEGAAPSASTDTLRARRGSWALATAPANIRTRFRGMYDDFRTPEAFEMLPVWESFYRPCRIRDQLRLLPFRNGVFLGWIGVVRRDGRRFTPSARTAANALVSQVEDGLAAARALESIGDACAYLLARPCGAVEQASRGVERWMSRERDAIVRSAIRAADRGELVECRIDGVSLRFARLDGAGGARYLATLVDMPSPRLSRAATLTPVEHSIATSAAAGLSVREIADEHQLSPNTIKTHLKSVYRKLEVASRMELAAMLKDD